VVSEADEAASPARAGLEAGAAAYLLQAIIDATEAPAFVKDVAGRYLIANEAFAQLLGCQNVDVLIGRRADELLPAHTVAEITANDQAVIDAGTTLSLELKINGFTFVYRKAPLRDAAGRLIGIVGIGRDPAVSHSALLREREDLLALAEEAGQLGVFEWQVTSGLMRLSPKFLSLYGMTEFDGGYQSWYARVFREDHVQITSLIENAFANQARELSAEFRITRADDDALKWMELRGIIFYDAHRRPLRVVGVNVDVTERKRSILRLRAFTETLEESIRERTRELEAEYMARQKAEESLRQAQKMEAVGQLTGGVAHDFNNLLTVVLGGLETIGRQIPHLSESPATARIVRARDMALQGVQRAVTLTTRLLAFSRQQPLIPKPLDANKLVSGVCELLRRTLGENISLETVLAGGLWPTFADANQLENALLNLALNARDAMPNGGKMTIETANCYLDEAYVHTLPEPVGRGQYVMIAVADTGVGMDQTTLEKAFEPFFTTKEVGKGTGLGLSQVYGFVRQSSGHVKIYSEVGEDTTVKIYLPRYFGTTEGGQTADMPDAMRAIGKETILVAEDDDALRTYTTDVLRELGYRVLEAGSGAEALEILARDIQVDLLFSDIVMPGGINGRQLADEALRRRPALKVLFTTGYTRNAIVHHGRLDPGTHLISKPFSFQELAAKLRTRLDSDD
jgi:signal transduction histidine kinase/ActR/RegA family two-component response regulator